MNSSTSLLDNIYSIFEKNNTFKIEWDKENHKALLSTTDKNISELLSDFLEFNKKNNITLKSLSIRKVTLEDLFISMTGRHLTD